MESCPFMIYLFSLGRTVDLCFAELESLLKRFEIEFALVAKIDCCAILETKTEIDHEALIGASGGIVKIGKMIKSIKFVDSLSIKKDEIDNKKDYKNFGISLVGFQANVVDLCEKFKEEINLHYILPKAGHELSSAQVLNKRVFEIVIVKNQEEYMIFQTLIVQDINFWTRKDVNRPNIDDRIGMLPLKVARMMINLGVCDLKEKNDKITLLDPFCGMGSILQEAVDLGVKKVIGGDISNAILAKCRANLEWFVGEFSCLHVNMKFICVDAVMISGCVNGKIDLIVTEPFLGDARKILTNTNQYYQILTNTKKLKGRGDVIKNIHNIIKGLEKMYLGCLKDWEKILKPEGVICIVVPEIELQKRIFTLPFVEICGKTGYNVLGVYDYAREKAVVRRKIYLLKKV